MDFRTPLFLDVTRRPRSKVDQWVSWLVGERDRRQRLGIHSSVFGQQRCFLALILAFGSLQTPGLLTRTIAYAPDVTPRGKYLGPIGRLQLGCGGVVVLDRLCPGFSLDP